MDILNEISKVIDTLTFDNCKYVNSEAIPYFEQTPYYKFLWAAMIVLQPKNVVELGTYWGLSGLAIMEGLPPDSEFTTVDNGAEDSNTHYHLNHVNDSRLHFIYASSLSVASRFSDIDFLYIDTAHNYEQVSKEWVLYEPLVSKGGVVLFDDIHLNDGMDRFWTELQGNKVDISEYHGSGFGIFFKEG